MKSQLSITIHTIPWYMVLVVCSLLLLPMGASAQSPEQLLQQKNYDKFLTHLPEEFASISQAKSSLEAIARVAVAIEKTNGWDGPSGKQARELLKDAPDALRCLNAVRLLLKQDPSGLAQLLQGNAPAPTTLIRVSNMLGEHGFTFAGNAIRVLTPDLPGKRILYLASIPKDKRTTIETTLLAYVKDPPNRMMLARTALDMFLRPPADVKIDPKEYYAIALKIGQGTSIVSFDTAQQLYQGGKDTEAVQMVTQLTVEQPADELLQLRAARFLRSMGNQAATTTLYQQALITVPEPQRREVRLDYLEYLQWQKKDDEITRLQTGKDALLAGDAALVTARYDDAVKQYVKFATNATTPVEQRLAAWAGLLDADPGQALTLGKSLFQTVANADPQLRSTLAAWTGRQFWAAMSREVPAKPGSFVMGWRKHFRPVHDVKDWETQATALASQLLETDTEACLRPDPRFTPDSFRYPAAMLYAFAGEPKKATEILSRTIEYQIPPPPGGWRIFDGTPAPDAEKPRTRTTPTLAETKKLTMQLMEDLARCPKADERVPALSAVLANDIVDKLAKDTKDTEIRTHLQELASVVKFTVVALDPLPRPLRTDLPPPPTRKVNMTRFAPIDAIVHKALANDTVAKQSLVLVNEGLRDALLTASNPELLTALTDLSSYTIQRYAEVCKQPQYAVDERKRLADYLTSRPVYDMKPYVTRLIEGVAK